MDVPEAIRESVGRLDSWAGAMTVDEATKLELLSRLISIDVVQSMQAAIVKGAADMLFGNKPEWFSTNPANTFVYAAVAALEQRSIVTIVEALGAKSEALRVSSEVRRKADLIMHRAALSHPWLPRDEWRGEKKKRFLTSDASGPNSAQAWSGTCSVR